MNKHDWLSIISSVFVMTTVLIAARWVDQNSARRYEVIQKRLTDIEKARQARQAIIRTHRTTTSTPEVDAVSRVTRRDSGDLPPTGRMVRPANVVRLGGDHHGDNNDGGFSGSS